MPLTCCPHTANLSLDLFFFVHDRHETSWLVRDSNGGVIANGEGYGNGETHAKEKCLTKNQCYILILSDTYGDG